MVSARSRERFRVREYQRQRAQGASEHQVVFGQLKKEVVDKGDLVSVWPPAVYGSRGRIPELVWDDFGGLILEKTKKYVIK